MKGGLTFGIFAVIVGSDADPTMNLLGYLLLGYGLLVVAGALFWWGLTERPTIDGKRVEEIEGEE